jgi:hypothetical protein
MSRQYRKLCFFLIFVSVSTLACAATLGFQPVLTYSVGTAPAAVSAGDFNADGLLDLAVLNAGDGSVSVLLGKGDGTFEAAMNFSACNNCTRIATGDFNADSKADLALLRPGDATAGDDGDVTIFLSNGDATFLKGQIVRTGNNPAFVVVQDVDADQKPDLIVSNATDGTVAILLGNGDNSFQGPIPYTTGAGPSSILLVDFDQDGLQDLAVHRVFGTDILLANGDGTFRTGLSINTGLFIAIVAWADFNQDGKTDYLATGCNVEGKDCSMSVVLGNGNGTFQNGRAIATLRASSIVIRDYDGDGKLDIVEIQANVAEQFGVLLGNGDGTFQPVVSSSVSSALSIGFGEDLNRDKAPDLVTVNSNKTISIFLNTGTDFSLSASNPTPTTLSPGQSASSNVTVTLLNAFDNPVALACTVQPATSGAPTCSVNPHSVTPAPDASQTAEVTINSVPVGVFAFTPLIWPLATVAGLTGIGVLSGRRKRMRASSFAGRLLLAGLLVQIACGQGSSSAQAYTVTITGSSTFSQHSTAVTVSLR